MGQGVKEVECFEAEMMIGSAGQPPPISGLCGDDDVMGANDLLGGLKCTPEKDSPTFACFRCRYINNYYDNISSHRIGSAIWCELICMRS